MTNTPEPAFGSPIRQQESTPWWWQLLDADGRVLEAERAEFPTRSDAETWLGEAYPDLVEDGASAVTLFEGDREVYGPMGLEAG